MARIGRQDRDWWRGTSPIAARARRVCLAEAQLGAGKNSTRRSERAPANPIRSASLRFHPVGPVGLGARHSHFAGPDPVRGWRARTSAAGECRRRRAACSATCCSRAPWADSISRVRAQQVGPRSNPIVSATLNRASALETAQRRPRRQQQPQVAEGRADWSWNFSGSLAAPAQSATCCHSSCQMSPTRQTCCFKKAAPREGIKTGEPAKATGCLGPPTRAQRGPSRADQATCCCSIWRICRLCRASPRPRRPPATCRSEFERLLEGEWREPIESLGRLLGSGAGRINWWRPPLEG